MGPTVNGPFRDMMGLGRQNIVTMLIVPVIVWDLNKGLIQVSGRSGEVLGQRGFTVYIYIYILNW